MPVTNAESCSAAADYKQLGHTVYVNCDACVQILVEYLESFPSQHDGLSCEVEYPLSDGSYYATARFSSP